MESPARRRAARIRRRRAGRDRLLQRQPRRLAERGRPRPDHLASRQPAGAGGCRQDVAGRVRDRAMTADRLSDSCAELARLLPAARTLMHVPAAAGTTAHGPPGSRPPWQSDAADAAMDAHEGLRRLEASMRQAVTGHHGRRRGGSDANTSAALDAIERLGAGLTADDAARAAVILDRWSRQVAVLPAVDTAEPWRRVPGASCPYCGTPMLRVQPRAGLVTCLRWGACSDADGNHPMGRMAVSGIDGSPQVIWNDGLV